MAPIVPKTCGGMCARNPQSRVFTGYVAQAQRAFAALASILRAFFVASFSAPRAGFRAGLERACISRQSQFSCRFSEVRRTAGCCVSVGYLSHPHLRLRALLVRNLARLGNTSPIQTAKGPVSVTMSFATLQTADWGVRSLEELLHETDAASYEAKSAGRDCLRIARPAACEERLDPVAPALLRRKP